MGVTILSGLNYVNAETQYLLNNENLENNQGAVTIVTDEEEKLAIHNDFLKVFPEEMAQIQKLGMSRSNIGKSEEELIDETKEMEPIIDTEKEVNGDYYRLVAYSNGIYSKVGIKGGTSTTGSGYVNYKNRKAYAQLYSSLANPVSGHTFTAIASYTNVNGGYDYISSAQPYSFYFCQNAYTHSNKKLKENSSGKAYVKFYYEGRSASTPVEAYNKYYLTLYVGKDTATVKADLRE